MAPQTERTHEENQERAYIAASRRSDRSIEARVQSARAASELHRKRTGKGFKITEDIVIKEEMYEEEDDDISPSIQRFLAGSAGASSVGPQFSAYLSGELSMRLQWLERERDIDQRFREQFPHFPTAISQNSTWRDPFMPAVPAYAQQQQQQQQQQQTQQQQQGQGSTELDRRASLPPTSPHATAPVPAWNPGHQARHSYSAAAIAEDDQPFTSVLPRNVQQIVGAGDLDESSGWDFDPSDPNMAQLLAPSQHFDSMTTAHDTSNIPAVSDGSYFHQPVPPAAMWQHQTAAASHQSGTVTPGGGADLAWDDWMSFTAEAEQQQQQQPQK
jgi:hypothetical protein